MAETIYRYNTINGVGNFNNPQNAVNSDNLYAQRNIPKNRIGLDDFNNRLEGTAHLVISGDHGNGTITKVEIGVEGYCENANNVNLNLRPKFEGTLEGAVFYQITGTNLGIIDDNTIDYKDVTHDANAPTQWNWGNVTNLDCQIWGENNHPFLSRSLYVDAIYLKITYNLPIIVQINIITIRIRPVHLLIPGKKEVVELDSKIVRSFNGNSRLNKKFESTSKIDKRIEIKSNIQYKNID